MKNGIATALLSAALFGASTPLAKLLLGAIDPWTLAGLLYLGSGVGLGGITLFVRARSAVSTEAKVAISDLPWLAGAVIAGGIIGPVALMFGLAKASASSAALLLNLEGLATMGIAWIVFRESVDRRLLFGAAAILAGAMVLTWHGGAMRFGPGSPLIALACIAWGIDNNLTRKVSAANPIQIAAIKGVVAGSVNLAIAATLGATLPAITTLMASAIVGFIGYGLSLALFVLALRHLGAARTGAYFSTAPFVGAVFSIALLHDPLTTQLGMAALLMAIGVWLHLTEHHAHQHTHERVVHDHSHTHDRHHQHEHNPGHPPNEPHAHRHQHVYLTHKHPHYPDLHHQHSH